jgi:hypothetical protein
MIVTVTKTVEMVSRWTDQVRHCMHVLATHYPASDWHDRAAVLNVVCTETLTANQVRDEYGGRTAGRRIRPGNAKPTRSLKWNDEICRDEFGLAGPFNQQQQVTRGTILRDIQAAITSLGLGNNAGLGAVSLVAGMDRAYAAPAAAGPVAPVPIALVAMAQAVQAVLNTAPPAVLAGSSTTAPAAQAGPSTATNAQATQTGSPAGTKRRRDQDSVGDDGERREGPGDEAQGDEQDGDGNAEQENGSDAESDGSCDPEEGGTDYYHSREIQREGGGYFVYRAILGLPYRDEPPAPLYPRMVHFPAKGMTAFRVLVCAVRHCDVCSSRRRYSASEDGDDEEDEEGEHVCSDQHCAGCGTQRRASEEEDGEDEDGGQDDATDVDFRG